MLLYAKQIYIQKLMTQSVLSHDKKSYNSLLILLICSCLAFTCTHQQHNNNDTTVQKCLFTFTHSNDIKSRLFPCHGLFGYVCYVECASRL